MSTRLLMITGIASFCASSLATSAPGDLDTSFGVGGVATAKINAPATNELVFDLALQSDGKIIAVGQSSSTSGGSPRFAVARFHPDGTLDTTFSGDGKLMDIEGTAEAVAIQADGKIVVAGGDTVIRYNADGSRDTTFSEDGLVVESQFSGGVELYAKAVTVLPSGEIVAAGAAVGAVVLVWLALLQTVPRLRSRVPTIDT